MTDKNKVLCFACLENEVQVLPNTVLQIFCSEKCKSTWKLISTREEYTSECEICDEEMTHSKDEDPICCSQECHDINRQNGKCNWKQQ